MKPIYLSALTAVVLMIFTSFTGAQPVTQQWAQVYSTGLVERSEKMVMDNLGNVHIVGQRSQSGGTGYALQFYAKYGTGGTFLHQRFLNPPCQNQYFRGCYAMDVTVDNSGNAYVCGYLDSAFGFLKGYIVKYNSNGDSVMGMYAGLNDTLQYVMWSSIKTDNAGNIYAGGYCFTYPQYTPYYLAAKYSPSGALLWAKRYRPAQYYSIGYYTCMELDNSGNIILASTMQKTSSSSSKDFHTVKFSNSGVFQWSASYNGPADIDDDLSDMSLDASGNVYVQGTSYVTGTNKEIACIKYNGSTGAQEWIYKVGGTGTNFGDDISKSITVSQSGIYITGSLFNTSSYEDGILIKLSPSGSELWRKQVMSTNGSSSDISADVAVDNAGFVYTLSTVNASLTQARALLCAYSSSGDSLWSADYSNPAMVLNSRNISVKGGSIAVSCDHSNTSNSDIVLVKYSHTTSVSTLGSEIPSSFSLGQNYPNPFNPATNIKFSIPKSGFVKLTVYDINGKVVEKLVNEQLAGGTYSADFDASNLASGVYFYRLESEGFSEVKKMMLVK